MRKLNLDKCKTNKEVCELVTNRIEEIPYDELLKQVKKKFIYQEKATKAIYTGLLMNINVFLSGLGGFGKSELIKCILDIYKIPYTVIVGYKDMPVDALLGIPNMDKLLNKSIYEINFKNSIFYEKKVIIAEEFTDILPSTAAVLKDILTEKGYRYKGEKIESFVPIMIIAANRTANDMIENNSTAALYNERFPLQVEVYWESYSIETYYDFLLLVFPDANEKDLYFMAKLFAYSFINSNHIISPRLAKYITKTFLYKGVDFIEAFLIDLTYLYDIKDEAEREFKELKTKKFFSDLEIDIKKSEDTLDVTNLLNYYYYVQDTLNNIKVSGDNVMIVGDIKKTITIKIKVLLKEFTEFNDVTDLINTIKK